MKQWYALRSKPKREMMAADLLENASIETYLPLVGLRQLAGKPAKLTPFFPNYLFARLDPQEGEIQLARFTRGVLHVVSFGDDPCPVPDNLIDLLKLRVESLKGRASLIDFAPGDHVAIGNGPLQGLDAIFDCYLSASGRAQVLIRLLHRLCRADVHVGQLRLLRKAGSSA